ncbi:hypothetical protein BDQ17DRAFT_1264979, partial [Cyathus striatus]
GFSCFICETDHDVGDIGRVEACECPRCLPSVTLDLTQGQRVLEHMGAHILFDPGVVSAKGVLCGLCLRSPSQCQYFLGKGKGASGKIRIDQKASNGCLMKMNFSYNVAAESTTSSPCSNVPVQCPICPKSDPAIWKYFLKHHFEDKHSSLKVSNYSHHWKISAFERDEMRKIWSKRTVGAIKPAKQTSKTSLRISEAHRAQISIRYLNPIIPSLAH